MDKTEEDENVALSIDVPSVHQQASFSAPVITVQSMHDGQCSALVRDLKPSVKLTIFTEASVRDIGKDRTKTVIEVGSQRATAQPEVKFATSKPPMTLMAGRSWVPLQMEATRVVRFKYHSLRTHRSSICQAKSQT